MNRPGPQFPRCTLPRRKSPARVSKVASRNDSASDVVGVSINIRSASPSPETAIVENGGSAFITARSSIVALSTTVPWAVSITASSLESPLTTDATYRWLPSGESAKSALPPVRMLPITLVVSGSISQTRPPGPPASGLGSSTYNQPAAGLAQFSTSMFESGAAEFRDVSVCVIVLACPAGAPVCAARAAGLNAEDTARRQNAERGRNKHRRRFAFIPRLRTPDWNRRFANRTLLALSAQRIRQARLLATFSYRPERSRRERNPARLCPLVLGWKPPTLVGGAWPLGHAKEAASAR